MGTTEWNQEAEQRMERLPKSDVETIKPKKYQNETLNKHHPKSSN